MQVGTVKTESFTMDYCCFGEGEKKLIILPGLSVQRVMGSAQVIAEVYAPLTKDFTVYVFERRNDLPSTYTVREMAEDTVRAMEALQLGTVSVFGASQGGMMAMEMAIGHPELMERLVLGSTSARVSEERLSLFASWVELAKAGDAKGLYLAFGEAIYPPLVFAEYQKPLEVIAETVTGEDLERFVTLVEGVKGFDIVEKLKKILCPVLVIGSADDQVLGGEASKEIYENLSGATEHELYMYEGYGHAAYDLAPDYKKRLLAFLHK